MNTTDGSGERQGHREAMDRVTRRLVESGTPAAKAERLARESMIRNDQRNGNSTQGKRK